MTRALNWRTYVVAAALGGAGVGFAQQPAPVPIPVAPAVKPAEAPRVQVQVVCVRVPAGFATRLGLADEKAGGEIACVLSPRETKMLPVVLRAEPELEFLARPQLTLTENQTGFFQIGTPTEVVAGLEAVTKDGVTLYAPKKLTVGSPGITLRLTPRLTPDGKSILLRSETTCCTVSGTPALIRVSAAQPAAGTKPADSFLKCLGDAQVNTQSMQTTVLLPDGGTAVIGGPAVTDGEQGPSELLWVMTAHAIKGAKPAEIGTVK